MLHVEQRASTTFFQQSLSCVVYNFLLPDFRCQNCPQYHIIYAMDCQVFHYINWCLVQRSIALSCHIHSVKRNMARVICFLIILL